jgi:hypothetical protein
MPLEIKHCILKCDRVRDSVMSLMLQVAFMHGHLDPNVRPFPSSRHSDLHDRCCHGFITTDHPKRNFLFRAEAKPFHAGALRSGTQNLQRCIRVACVCL